jgi:hypothetical protein
MWRENHPLFGKHLSDETKRKISEKLKGRPFSDEVRGKLSEANKGKVLSEETRRRMGKAREGEENPNWQGGKSFEPYPQDWTEALRETIRRRDNYACKWCSKRQNELTGWFKKLSVHHIDYDKRNCDPKNLITLCNSCNGKVNRDREYWKLILRGEVQLADLLTVV